MAASLATCGILRKSTAMLIAYAHRQADPAHDDARVSRMVGHARKLAGTHEGPLIIEAAREGLELHLGRSKVV